MNSASAIVKKLDENEINKELIEFNEGPSAPPEEKNRLEDEESKNINDEKKTTFIKRFGFEKEETLIDSFVWAVAKKILLQGRIYITNQRIWFHSFFNNKLLFFGKDTKIAIPLDHIKVLEKRVNAIFFDNSIAVITKDDSETFFTSFIQRDKCFELIKGLLEGENKTDDANYNNLMKRTFIRMAKEESSDGEGEEEEEEEEGKSQSSQKEVQVQLHASGQKAAQRNFEPENSPESNEGQNDVKLDIRNPENMKRVDELWHKNDLKIKEINDELDPDWNEEYQELYKYSIDNMTLPCFYNRIFGCQPYEGTDDKIFWRHHIETVSDNSNIKVLNSIYIK